MERADLLALARELGPYLVALLTGGGGAVVATRRGRRAARAHAAASDAGRDGAEPCAGCSALRREFEFYRTECDRDRKALREDLKHDVANLREIVADVEEKVAVALDRTAGDRPDRERGRGRG